MLTPEKESYDQPDRILKKKKSATFSLSKWDLCLKVWVSGTPMFLQDTFHYHHKKLTFNISTFKIYAHIFFINEL